MHDNALPVGGKDDALDGEELLHGLEGRQQGPRGLVEHKQAVQGDAVAQVIHHQKRHLTRRDTYRMGGFRQGRVSSQLQTCVWHHMKSLFYPESHRVQRYQYKFRGHRLRRQRTEREKIITQTRNKKKNCQKKKKRLLGSTLLS